MKIVNTDNLRRTVNALGNRFATKNELATGLNTKANNSHSHSYLPLQGGTMTGNIMRSIPGGQWLIGKDVSKAFLGITSKQDSSYHPLMSVQTESDHYISMGGIYDKFGFFTYKSDRTENGIDSEFTFDAQSGNVITSMNIISDKNINTSASVYATGNISSDSTISSPVMESGVFRVANSTGYPNNIITGGNGDNASWDTHNLVIKSHWGIGFRDYQDQCRIVFDTRTGSISTQGNLYTSSVVSAEQGLYTNGYVSAQGDLSCASRAWLTSVTVSDKFIGESKFCSADGYYADPWEGIGCSIKAQGNIACNGTAKVGYLNTAQSEFNGWPGSSQSFIRVTTSHDGNGQGDGETHIGYNNGDGYHHFFRGTGAMHINMHQGVQVSNNFIYLAGIPLTISGDAPSIGGVWIQI